MTGNKNTSGMEIDDDGNVVVYESERDKERRFRKERLESIRECITDTNYDPSAASRLIAIEIARVAEDLGDCMGDGPMDTIKLKIYEQQLKALRELGKQLTDADTLSKKDVLNFDGPKFQYVLGIIVDNFLQSLKEAGVPEDLRASIMKHYRDRMQMSEQIIRKETARIDSNKSK
jgi:hypothetical protein